MRWIMRPIEMLAHAREFFFLSINKFIILYWRQRKNCNSQCILSNESYVSIYWKKESFRSIISRHQFNRHIIECSATLTRPLFLCQRKIYYQDKKNIFSVITLIENWKIVFSKAGQVSQPTEMKGWEDKYWGEENSFIFCWILLSPFDWIKFNFLSLVYAWIKEK